MLGGHPNDILKPAFELAIRNGFETEGLLTQLSPDEMIFL